MSDSLSAISQRPFSGNSAFTPSHSGKHTGGAETILPIDILPKDTRDMQKFGNAKSEILNQPVKDQVKTGS